MGISKRTTIENLKKEIMGISKGTMEEDPRKKMVETSKGIMVGGSQQENRGHQQGNEKKNQ